MEMEEWWLYEKSITEPSGRAEAWIISLHRVGGYVHFWSIFEQGIAVICLWQLPLAAV